MSKTVVKFDTRKLRWELLEHFTTKQIELLVNYAKEEIQRIGARINSLNGENNFDRTGNLLDSLCWGVSFNGKLQDYGFYREQKAGTFSTLHEWSRVGWNDPKSGYSEMMGSEFMPEVWGHDIAERYVHKYGNNGAKGFKVFFAILAPYWGYWEKGFNMKHGFGGTSTFQQAPIMAEFYDEVKADLKGARVNFRVSVAKYTSVSLAKTMKKAVNGRR